MLKLPNTMSPTSAHETCAATLAHTTAADLFNILVFTTANMEAVSPSSKSFLVERPLGTSRPAMPLFPSVTSFLLSE